MIILNEGEIAPNFTLETDTFVIRDAHVERVFRDLKPDGHAAEVLAAL